MTIDIGTIGHLPCEIALNDILIKLNNKKISRKVMRLYSSYKDVLKDLAGIANTKTHATTILYFRNHYLEIVDSINFPENIETHLKCAIVAQYRKNLNLGD